MSRSVINQLTISYKKKEKKKKKKRKRKKKRKEKKERKKKKIKRKWLSYVIKSINNSLKYDC